MSFLKDFHLSSFSHTRKNEVRDSNLSGGQKERRIPTIYFNL